MKRIHVVAAVIKGDNAGREGEILLAKRPDHLHQGGKWEFPGGKVESSEDVSCALIRELQEELNITPTHFNPLIQIHHDYSDKSVFLDVWEVGEFDGEPKGMEGQLIEWAPSSDLEKYEFPAANVPIVAAAMLPDVYWVTPELDGDEVSFLKLVESKLQQGIKLIQFRVKSQDKTTVLELLERTSPLCEKFGANLFVNSDTFCLIQDSLCENIKAKVQGIHLTSQHLHDSLELPLGYVRSASCHSIEDIQLAEETGCQFATLSPIQATESHPGQAPLEISLANQWVQKAKLPLYALGGMSDADLNDIRIRGFQGVAGIREVGLKGVNDHA